MDNNHQDARRNLHKEKERENEKRIEKKKDGKNKEIKGRNCNNCGARNDPGAKFCEECGEPLGSFNCRNCGTKYQPGQDICEKCGSSLLENSCRFCYAQTEPDDKFCPECGNPTAGIVCGKCSAVSHFDFCPKCNNPLTEAALIELEKVKNDPQIQAINSLFSEYEELEAEEVEEESLQDKMQQRLQEEMEKERISTQKKFEQMRREFNKTTGGQAPKKDKPKPAPEKSKPNIPVFKKKKNRAELEARKKEILKKVQAEMDKLKVKTFSDPQAARRYFNANRPAGNYVWNCNFNDSVHPDPNNCGSPEKGGRWVVLYDDIEWEYHDGNM